MGRPELAFLEAAPDGGLALRHKAVRIDAEQADFLSPQQARDQQTEGRSREDESFFHSFR